jgi:hypothetical protein
MLLCNASQSLADGSNGCCPGHVANALAFHHSGIAKQLGLDASACSMMPSSSRGVTLGIWRGCTAVAFS